MDYSPPDSSVHGISQARILEWVAMLSSGGVGIFLTQGSKQAPALQTDSLLSEPPGKPNNSINSNIKIYKEWLKRCWISTVLFLKINFQKNYRNKKQNSKKTVRNSSGHLRTLPWMCEGRAACVHALGQEAAPPDLGGNGKKGGVSLLLFPSPPLPADPQWPSSHPWWLRTLKVKRSQRVKSGLWAQWWLHQVPPQLPRLPQKEREDGRTCVRGRIGTYHLNIIIRTYSQR